jgi:hypothetical protein
VGLKTFLCQHDKGTDMLPLIRIHTMYLVVCSDFLVPIYSIHITSLGMGS